MLLCCLGGKEEKEEKSLTSTVIECSCDACMAFFLIAMLVIKLEPCQGDIQVNNALFIFIGCVHMNVF